MVKVLCCAWLCCRLCHLVVALSLFLGGVLRTSASVAVFLNVSMCRTEVSVLVVVGGVFRGRKGCVRAPKEEAKGEGEESARFNIQSAVDAACRLFRSTT